MYKLLIPFCLIFQSCAGSATENSLPQKKEIKEKSTVKIFFKNVEILILKPADSVKVAGDLLLLPGWNFKNTKWCDSTDVCKTALAKGYRVIAPQMGQSIYATHYFPETRADLRKYPTLLWLDSAIQFLSDSLHMFQLKKFVLGLSTGARGVALICEKRSGFFTAAAALSGDYDQVAEPRDPLCTLVYGPFQKYGIRWQTVDNPDFYLQNNPWTTPIYLGHAKNDKIVPYTQTHNFKISIHQCAHSESFNFEKDCVFKIVENAGHNFSYWRSELPAIWKFFDSY
jgi:pimeloyl-ACP methyl ester carboxylesterase